MYDITARRSGRGYHLHATFESLGFANATTAFFLSFVTCTISVLHSSLQRKPDTHNQFCSCLALQYLQWFA
jgi:hypothetical protein